MENEYLLVQFFAPWCIHSRRLAPEYSKAAGVLARNNSSIKLAKVDATEETDLADYYNITHSPTLVFFKKGELIEYGGGRTSDSIISWVEENGPKALVEERVDKALQALDKLSQQGSSQNANRPVQPQQNESVLTHSHHPTSISYRIYAVVVIGGGCGCLLIVGISKCGYSLICRET